MIVRFDKCSKKLEILRIVLDKQLGKTRTGDRISRSKAILSCHRIVAFGQITMLVRELNLFIYGKIRRDRLVKLEPPDPLGTLFDKRAVSFFAAFHGVLSVLFGSYVD